MAFPQAEYRMVSMLVGILLWGNEKAEVPLQIVD